MAPAVRCTMLTESPCTLEQAASFMKKYAACDFLPSEGVTLSYVSGVAKSLRDAVVRQKKLAKGTLVLASAGAPVDGFEIKVKDQDMVACEVANEGGDGQANGGLEKAKRERDEEKKLSWKKVLKKSEKASGDVLESKASPTKEVKSVSVKKRKREKAAAVDSVPAPTVVAEDVKLAWKKIGSSGEAGISIGNEASISRKKRKKDKSAAAET